MLVAKFPTLGVSPFLNWHLDPLSRGYFLCGNLFIYFLKKLVLNFFGIQKKLGFKKKMHIIMHSNYVYFYFVKLLVRCKLNMSFEQHKVYIYRKFV